MCYRNASGGTVCEVYTEASRLIDFKIGLNPTLNDNETEEICKYPFGKAIFQKYCDHSL